MIRQALFMKLVREYMDEGRNEAEALKMAHDKIMEMKEDK